MNDSLQLYEISKEIEDIIESSVDSETGEISPEAIQRFEKLQLDKEAIITSIGLSYHLNGSKSEAVNNEIKRLQTIKKSYETRQNAAERLLKRAVRLGEEFKYKNLVIKWQKCPPKVEVDEIVDLSLIQKSNPDLVKVKTEYQLDKTLVKEYSKKELPLPEGIRVIQDYSLRIK